MPLPGNDLGALSVLPSFDLETDPNMLDAVQKTYLKSPRSQIHQPFLFLLIILAYAEISTALLEPYNVNSRRHVIESSKKIASTGASLLLSYALSSRKVDAASGKSAEYPDAAAFYQLYQYKEPKDILVYINDCNIRDGEGSRVTEALETFSVYYPMYKLSKEKVLILTDEIKKFQPQNVLEIGTFFGYSALSMAMNLPPGASLTCIEGNKNNADVARFVLDKGLGPSTKARESVRIVDGISSTVLKSYESLLGTKQFDFVFLDHDKDCYLKDLKTLETNGMLAPNCIIVADNVVFPGAPGYLEYVTDTEGKSAGNEGTKQSDSSIVKGR